MYVHDLAEITSLTPSSTNMKHLRPTA